MPILVLKEFWLITIQFVLVIRMLGVQLQIIHESLQKFSYFGNDE